MKRIPCIRHGPTLFQLGDSRAVSVYLKQAW